SGVGKWITTNGGIGTVTMPTLYEFHEIFLCNDISRPKEQNMTINGPGCFASDQVYRNVRMPEIDKGEIIAVMDSGAYFTSWESSFGFPRPAIAMVKDGLAHLIRRRESLLEMSERDVIELPKFPR
ncbi:MAG: diaminopimelate decarboxylase, partial [Saprospiraceae bacterium]|nr:diaminopimelate decarboxylase [Saprospiraceae bacterium]